ncbi:MAG: hypothetical protein K2W96_11660, partial [Gemmataceae bacterium]|nr:hypothetical protein [Gemmataceae bacterium]
MGLTTLLRFLVGDAVAIRRIAQDRHALWVGFAFVLSAGFAREYDGADLVAGPLWVVIPLVASLLASFVMWTFFLELAWRPTEGEADTEGVRLATRARFWSGYLSFLGLFWMTAPLAWLYAILYERFLSYEDAMDANVRTLGVVALWRVLLLARRRCLCLCGSPNRRRPRPFVLHPGGAPRRLPVLRGAVLPGRRHGRSARLRGAARAGIALDDLDQRLHLNRGLPRLRCFRLPAQGREGQGRLADEARTRPRADARPCR